MEKMMGIFVNYRKVQAKHVKELQTWVDSDPLGRASLQSHIGTKRSIEQYVDEYGDRFAIAALLAGDIGYPRASKMLKEYKPFKELEDEMG